MQYLTLWDLILGPIYLIILIAIARKMRDKRYPPGHALRQYYLNGLYAKFGGAIFIALVYQYYYRGGDTYNFYTHSVIINSSLKESFYTWWHLILRTPATEVPEVYAYAGLMQWYSDPASYAVGRIGAIFGLFCGTSYIPIALLFAFFAFSGTWAMYRTFVNIFPKLHKELAYAFLFIPSTIVWGSAVFKDTICMWALGWLTYCTFRIFVNRDFSIKNLFLLCLSFYLIAVIKIYILIAFLPALTVWLLLTYSHKIKSAGVRFFLKIGVIALVGVGFIYFSEVFSNQLAKYSLENIAKTAEATRDWISYATIKEEDEGSVYNLGDFDPSFTGMLTKFPQAVVVTLFRPFPWEARKIFVLLSALEALVFVYFTWKAFAKNGLGKSISLINKDPNLFFCITFTLIFAFAVGISSYNFGALSRYKIPCLPFYAAFLMILMNYRRLNTIPAIQNKKTKLLQNV
jgi:uncharacterized membrane protein